MLDILPTRYTPIEKTCGEFGWSGAIRQESMACLTSRRSEEFAMLSAMEAEFCPCFRQGGGSFAPLFLPSRKVA